ncbi:hypothetical protein NPIL_240511 [Nephila pilipes]|uniref:Uncharacterized protein n=1 Tax=Nephila pilipes TaxID=299642 RepID=A0A8X6U8G0_NEPPI|nr:hypothetical protein NPIL_240511 [Nephila pilipes]
MPNLFPLFFLVTAIKNKIFNVKIHNDLETITNMLLSDSNNYENIVLEEIDKEEEEHISEREDDSESELQQQAIQKMKIRTIDLQMDK